MTKRNQNKKAGSKGPKPPRPRDATGKFSPSWFTSPFHQENTAIKGGPATNLEELSSLSEASSASSSRASFTTTPSAPLTAANLQALERAHLAADRRSNMPARASLNGPQWQKDDRVLCFHGELLYEAKILLVRPSEGPDGNGSYEYRVHYKGWKASWDDWVPAECIRKPTEENKELARTLQREYAASTKGTSATKGHGKKGISDDISHTSDDRQASLPVNSRKRGHADLEKEEEYRERPEVKIPCPDVLKSITVDDWEHITKNLMLVNLPSKSPVAKIIDDYVAQEKVKRAPGSAEADLLDEIDTGLRSYFNSCLGRILLYKFEREQYAQVRKQWINEDGKGAANYYGGEHLIRLLVSLPRLIAQTNLDRQAVNQLRGEIVKFQTWLARHSDDYFRAAYEPASQEYIEKARSN